jgi:large subunit ribosomal protein L21
MYAIIEEGGKQFKVTSGDTIEVDRAPEGDAKTLTFDRVLLVAGEGEPRIGAPLVGGATVTADVLGPVKGPKVTTVKYRRRKGYRKKIGHRQQLHGREDHRDQRLRRIRESRALAAPGRRTERPPPSRAGDDRSGKSTRVTRVARHPSFCCADRSQDRRAT